MLHNTDSSSLLKTFARNWAFIHEIIIPDNSQANRAAAGAVKIAKRILRKSHSSSDDPSIHSPAKYSNRGAQYESGAETVRTTNQVDDVHG